MILRKQFIIILAAAAVTTVMASSRSYSITDSRPGRHGSGMVEREVRERPRIGLVLSGGGAKGMAHIGAIKVIEEAGVQIDIVTGTSMGSIIGGFYAIGYSPDEIEKAVLDIDWMKLFIDDFGRRNLSIEDKRVEGKYLVSLRVKGRSVQLPSGLIEGQKIYALFSKIAWPARRERDFTKFKRPFSCVATDIETGDAVVLDSGYLPDAMRASMAIPTVFTPVEINGKLLIDGGFIRNLPAIDAKRLGADIIIAVDVSKGLMPADSINSALDIVTQSMSFLEARMKDEQLALCDIIITPDMAGLNLTSFSRADEIISRGEEAAREVLDQLTMLADSFPRETDTVVGDALTIEGITLDTILVSEIDVEGLDQVPSKMLSSELGIEAPCLVTPDELENIVNRIYGSGYFRHVSWRLEPIPGGEKLVILVLEDRSDYIRIGLHYDSYWRSALMLNFLFRNLIGHGSSLSLGLETSEFTRLSAGYSIHAGTKSRIGVRLQYSYIDDEIDYFSEDKRFANESVVSNNLGLYLETTMASLAYSAFGLKSDWVTVTPNIAPVAWEKNSDFLVMAKGSVEFDTVDRAFFPHSGIFLKVSALSSEKKLGSDLGFKRAHGYTDLYIPAGDRITILAGAEGGATDGDIIPAAYMFHLGGINSSPVLQEAPSREFIGLEHEEYNGRHFFSGRMGVRFELRPALFLEFKGQVGNAVDEIDLLFDREELVIAGGVTAGYNSFLGPLEFTISTSKRHNLMTFFNLGSNF